VEIDEIPLSHLAADLVLKSLQASNVEFFGSHRFRMNEASGHTFTGEAGIAIEGLIAKILPFFADEGEITLMP
jgi:hypothetical protein